MNIHEYQGKAVLKEFGLPVSRGVAIFSPDGKQLGLLNTDDRTANVEFGEDGSTLFICANHNLLRIRTTTKGQGF